MRWYKIGVYRSWRWIVKKRILITGGAGFIGYFLASSFAEENYNVVILDNFVRGKKDQLLNELISKHDVQILNVNCMDFHSVMEINKDFDYIVHLAAIIGVKHVNSNPYSVLENNILMLNNIIKFSNAQKNLSRLLFASTSEVYSGTLENFGMQIPTPEDTPLTINSLDRKRTSYMLSKIYGEAMCIQSGLPYTIFRPHNIYGPRMGMSHVIPEQLKKAYETNDGEIVSIASAEHSRCFCFIDDAIEMLKRIIINESCVNKILNLGVESPEISIEKLIKLCWKVVGKEFMIKKEGNTIGSPMRRAPNMKKTTNLIGHFRETDLENGIKKTYDWYLSNVFKAKVY